MSGLLALLDDVAAIAKVAAASVDDIAGAAAKAGAKAAGVVIDDAAVTPKYVHGFEAKRELPIIWRISLGSLKNKLIILLPVLLALDWAAPWAITPLLMLGGAFLCFEGFEKVAHKFLHKEEADTHDAELQAALEDPNADLAAMEKDKIKGAVRTDFILSAEIIAITLGAVAQADFWTQLAVLVGIALIMTVGVYGLVGGIVKLDDLGLYLSQKASSAAQAVGRGILWLAPWLMKFLSVAGTAAMFLVGGGIIAHGIGPLYALIEQWSAAAGGLGWLVGMLANAVVGIVTGGIVVAVVTVFKKMRGGSKQAAAH